MQRITHNTHSPFCAKRQQKGAKKPNFRRPVSIPALRSGLGPRERRVYSARTCTCTPSTTIDLERSENSVADLAAAVKGGALSMDDAWR